MTDNPSGTSPPSPSADQPDARPPRRDRTRAAIAGLVAVALVALGIVVINLLNRPEKGKPSAGPTSTQGAPLTTSPAGPSTGPSGTPSPSARSPATTGPPRASTPASPGEENPPNGAGEPSGAGTPSGPPETGAGPGGSVPRSPGMVFAPVSVYNNSRIQGLGSQAAKKVRAAGFEVKRVTGVFGQWAKTTVYYDPPQQAAAQTLIGLVPGIERALPRPRWLLRTNTLILIVTRDFPVDP